MDTTTPVLTARLSLERPEPGDLDELHAMWSDPAMWEPTPSGRHTGRQQSETVLAHAIGAWEGDGLSWWVARSTGGAGALVGTGGCTLRRGIAWNLGYGLTPSAWGRGYAQEIIAAARAAAAGLRPDLPVVVRTVESNVRSRRTAERAGGFALVRRGPDAGSPDPGTASLLYADRPLDEATAEALTAP